MSDDRPPPKREVFLELIQAPSMFVHLDARRLNVVVPLAFKTRPQLVLELGLNMPKPIPDLHADDWGISATLSFGGQPFLCRLPWDSIYAMVGSDGRGMVWPDDVPDEVAANLGVQRAPKPTEDQAERAPKKKARPKKFPSNVVPFRRQPDEPRRPAPIAHDAGAAERLDGDATSPPHKPKPPSGGKPKRALPSYLRVVK